MPLLQPVGHQPGARHHTNLRSTGAQLAVTVLGRAKRLISSFAARPGDRLPLGDEARHKTPTAL